MTVHASAYLHRRLREPVTFAVDCNRMFGRYLRHIVVAVAVAAVAAVAVASVQEVVVVVWNCHQR